MENVFKDLEEMMENGDVNEVEAFFNQLIEEQEDEKKREEGIKETSEKLANYMRELEEK